jgi:hypothetical protein
VSSRQERASWSQASKQAPHAIQRFGSTLMRETPLSSGSVEIQAPTQLQTLMHLLQPTQFLLVYTKDNVLLNGFITDYPFGFFVCIILPG